jgi:mannose-6-phosphate isomerase-like protein (cupin superfamily)
LEILEGRAVMTSVHDDPVRDDTARDDTAAGPGTDPQPGKRKVTWYDEGDAKELMASGVMTPTVLSPEVIGVMMKGSKLHLGNGSRVLFQDPENNGFSVVHAWFGENFPLPRHTHSGDCMYYVLKGELRMGAKTVKAGSGFFVPGDRPYTYRAGPGGVEVLEFRKVSSGRSARRWGTHGSRPAPSG